MSLDVYSVVLTLGSIGIFIGLFGLLTLSLTTKFVKQFTITIRYEQYLALIAVISVTSIIFSLTYQLVYETPVCELCWWQRIFLYPVSVITLVALWFRTREAHVTTAILAGFGLYIACYHYYYHFQGYVLGKTLSLPCSYGGLLPACTKTPVFVLGFVTIPFMGILVFGSFLILAWLAYKVRKQYNPTTNLVETLFTFNKTTMESVNIEEVATIKSTQKTSIGIEKNKRTPYFLYGAVLLAAVMIVIAFLFTRGYIITATVNGSPISRLAIIQELEKQGGKQALEAMINEKVIMAEFEKLGIFLGENDVSDEIKKIEAQIATQGGTLTQVLEQQGMTMEILEEQIESQLKLEKALSDKIKVTDEEISTFIEENQIEILEGEAGVTLTAQIVDQIKQQKLQTEAAVWVKSVTDKANIKYYVRY